MKPTTLKQMTTTYNVNWQVVVTLPATMEVEAPEGLNEEQLIEYIRQNEDADFTIDTDHLEYDDGFAELECGFTIN